MKQIKKMLRKHEDPLLQLWNRKEENKQPTRDDVVQILNIAFLESGEPCIIGQKYKFKENLYELPVESSRFGICIVSDILTLLQAWPLKDARKAMAFAIVKFINKRLVEVVPSSWINGSMCFWPSGKPERINKLVRASAKAQEDWKQHAVEIKEVFSSNERARKKLEKSQFTSDLASTDEEVQRRPVQRPRRFTSDSNSDGSPPKEKSKKSKQPCIDSAPTLSSTTRGFSLFTCISHCSFGHETGLGTSAHSPANMKKCTKSPRKNDGLSQRVFQKQVLRHLQVMRLMLEQNRELLEALQAKNMRSEAIVPSLLPEPFNDVQEFTSFDETIQDATRDQLGAQN
ncbi:uncharacterized protein LOC121045622 [Ixodes scapularis]|uniref:uncharacterized protein LOC121045622 n=1 Tax=Ixodes scapularis TaxID=6945 RepID=UPI001C37FDB2|nr:uncharacterized protein LOC121045622 [Ixodes scapularis]